MSMHVSAPYLARRSLWEILSLYVNNLVRMGSLAPLVGLKELRINGNNLEELPGSRCTRS